MYRAILEGLKAWQKKEKRLPVLLTGGIQVGKTWTLKEFGKSCFRDMLYIDCRKKSYMTYIAEDNLEPGRILSMLGIYLGKPPKKDEVLIIFDEVQAIDGLLKALIHFSQQMPEYHICFTGAFADRACLRDEAELADKVEVLELWPMNFREFMEADGELRLLNRVLEVDKPMRIEEQLPLVHYVETYLMVGGMPEAVQAWIQRKDLPAVRKIHFKILEQGFQRLEQVEDMVVRERIQKCWRAILEQRVEENSDLDFLERKELISGQGEKLLETLTQTGFVYKINRASKGLYPLKDMVDQKRCRVYLIDVGLLTAIFGLNEEIFKENTIFQKKNRLLLEHYTWQQISANPNIGSLFYWSENVKKGEEVDFIFEDETEVVPVEIQTEESINGLKHYIEKYHPNMRIQISMSELKQTREVLTVPFYALWNL